MELYGLHDAENKPFMLVHDVSIADKSFVDLLIHALHGEQVGIALGPIYTTDPATELLAPFIKSASESGWNNLSDDNLAPKWVMETAKHLRSEAAIAIAPDISIVNEWTRAGLLLHLASDIGIMIKGAGLVHPRWRMRGTVTERFGVGTIRIAGTDFNPLTIAAENRSFIIPRTAERRIAVIDFRAMDLCSMLSILPSFPKEYIDADDLHAVTANLIGCNRDMAKKEIFVHAYGGTSCIRREFERKFPELDALRLLPQGDAGRKVQLISSIAFRAALSNALPLLVSYDVLPMFAVHDEIVLDHLSGLDDNVAMVAKAMEQGASQRIGFTYKTRVSTGGMSYIDVK